MPNAKWQWKLDFWKSWGWLVVLLGALATGAIWAVWPAAAAWFLLGFGFAILVLLLLCLWLLEPPRPPPPPGQRLRLINCDPKKHLRKLRLRLKGAPEDPGWREREPLTTVVDLAPGQFWDFDPPQNVQVFGLQAEVDANGEQQPEDQWLLGPTECESVEPIDVATILVQVRPQIQILPGQILEECPS